VLVVVPLTAVRVGVVGTTGAHLLRRLAGIKLLFGAGQAAAGISAASLVVMAMPAVGPTVNGRPIIGAILGMGLYVAVNLTAMLGLLRRLGGDEATEGLRAQIPLATATMIGQIATGVVLAVLVELDLTLVPFIVAPAAAVYLAARGATRTTDLLTRVRAERDRMTRVVDGASDGILLLDRDATVQVWNPSMERMTGVDANVAVGRSIADVLTDDVRVARTPVRGRWLIDRAHEGGVRRETEATLVHSDGSERATRESHALVFDDRGRCTGDVVVVRDVTRQQELERLRSDFVARVSHELRTPLTPIRGFASVLLRRGGEISPQQRDEALERILERADHLGALVEDLLLVTRLDRGELEDVVHVRPTDLRQVTEEAVASMEVREPARVITLHVAPGTGEALADASRVRQVLDALLDNACRYSPSDAPVEVELDQTDDDVRIRVCDHGPGIPREHHERVFERFTRLEDPLTMRTGGVGLGLFLARQLATAMAGTLTLEEPRPGGGCVIELRLPATEPIARPGIARIDDVS
jgi:PAS domain S-box-containing protein